SLRSFIRLPCAASVARSGHTQDTNAMRLLSRNHLSANAPVAMVVRRVASPPSGAIRYTCGSASSFRFAVNAIHFPSGDQRGSLSLSPAVSLRGFANDGFAPNPVGKSHSSVTPSFLSMSYDVTGAHAYRPSGASVGAPMRLIAHNASTSSGFLLRRAVRRAGMKKSFRLQSKARFKRPPSSDRRATPHD